MKQLVEATPPSDLLSAAEKEELWSAVASGDQEVRRLILPEHVSHTLVGKVGHIPLHALQEAAVEKTVREKILERRSAVHERCKAEVEKRSRFEDGVSHHLTVNSSTPSHLSLFYLSPSPPFLFSD